MKKADIEDILKLYDFLDEAKIDQVFAACDLRRIPRIDPADAELCLLITSMEHLREKVDNFSLSQVRTSKYCCISEYFTKSGHLTTYTV